MISNAINYLLLIQGDLLNIVAYTLTILELLGASFYIFLLSFNVSFLLEKKMGCISDKANRNKVIKCGLVLVLLGIPYNIILNPSLIYPYNLWGWNILTFLGFSQIICYLAYKMVRWTRIITGILIIFLTSGIREILYFGKDLFPFINVLYFIFVSPYPNYPLFPYASICFFSTVFGELIYEAKLLDSKIADLHAIKTIAKFGIVLLCVGFIVSIIELHPLFTLGNYNPDKYPFIDMLSLVKSQFLIFVPNLPGIFLKGTPPNLFFSMGFSLVWISLIFYYYYFKQKDPKISKIFMLFGKFTVTLLFIQFLFLYPFYQKVTIMFVFPLLIIYIVVLGLIIYLWETHASNFPSIDKLIFKITD